MNHPYVADPVDVAVIGAGIGGLYGIRRFLQAGLKVVGIEAASEVGGVWNHNRYPGARVDLESENYCYMFDPDLYAEWKWSERYAGQPEILAYLNHVADRFDLRRHIRFDTWMTGAEWSPEQARWIIKTSVGRPVAARHLVMATGQLSKPRKPPFPGLDAFRGDWYQTSHWPAEPVELAGKRVAVFGTGSSGVQVITAIAPEVAELTVFQRTPNYSVPAQNRPADRARHQRLAGKIKDIRREVRTTGAGNLVPPAAGRAGDFTDEQQQQLLEQRWAFGGQPILGLFTDQGVDTDVNNVVGDFVRSKIRQKVDNDAVAEKLAPNAYPIGVRRLCVDTGYYETFNRPNVHLVSLLDDPVIQITADGVQTESRDLKFDVLIFALGFEAFTGALDQANIRNEHGNAPTESWTEGPQTLLGLMTPEFPNLYLITGAGSTSVLTNMFVANEHHIDMVADLVTYMQQLEYRTVQPEPSAVREWGQHCAEVAEPLIRRQVDNYMVQVTPSGDRVFLPYGGPFADYVAHCEAQEQSGYPGFLFS